MKSVEGTDSSVNPKVKINNLARTSFRLSNPFTNTQDGLDDFDRRSAGERFGKSAYHEFMKVNNLLQGGAFKRRQSCSKSQSHSRVRM